VVPPKGGVAQWCCTRLLLPNDAIAHGCCCLRSACTRAGLLKGSRVAQGRCCSWEVLLWGGVAHGRFAQGYCSLVGLLLGC
jgi:hypothetical protein